MHPLDGLQNALQAIKTAKDKGDYELALIEAHNAVDCANEYALLIGGEFIESRKQERRKQGTALSVVV